MGARIQGHLPSLHGDQHPDDEQEERMRNKSQGWPLLAGALEIVEGGDETAWAGTRVLGDALDVKRGCERYAVSVEYRLRH